MGLRTKKEGSSLLSKRRKGYTHVQISCRFDGRKHGGFSLNYFLRKKRKINK